jgi:nucleotide-binding universal stress UspA family protein
VAFKRILCAVDFSPDSVEAFTVAVKMARREPAALHLLHVIEAEPVVNVGEVVVRVVENANAAMKKLLESAGPSLAGLSPTTEVITGAAFHEIVDRARAWRADLAVLGARGAATLEDLEPGETVKGVVEQAPCSVLVVRTQ